MGFIYLALALAISFLGGNIVRNNGKQVQKRLWKEWGGDPATRFLRHTSNEVNYIQKNKCHKNLEKYINIKLPTKEGEQQNPQEANKIYEGCVNFLKGKTRNRENQQLLFQENINYGFIRNLLGIKKYGLLVSLLGLISSLLFIFLVQINSLAILICCVCIVFFLFWMLWINEEKVHMTAKEYAARLIEYCEQMENY